VCSLSLGLMDFPTCIIVYGLSLSFKAFLSTCSDLTRTVFGTHVEFNNKKELTVNYVAMSFAICNSLGKFTLEGFDFLANNRISYFTFHCLLYRIQIITLDENFFPVFDASNSNFV